MNNIIPFSLDCVVFIGRFQPFHHAHAETLKQALLTGKIVVMIVGSAYRCRSIKNPFTLAERIEMITEYCNTAHPYDTARIVFEGIEDRYYNEKRWLDEVQTAVLKYCPQGKISIIGYEKDDSTYYLRSFPNFSSIIVENYLSLHATDIRHLYFTSSLWESPKLTKSLPPTVQHFLKKFEGTSAFEMLAKSYTAIAGYKKEWAVAPYPPILVTVDALVLCHNHVLLIQRGHHPGLGFWAMPGGFLDTAEWIKKGIIRELLEETQLDVPLEELAHYLQMPLTFDYPDRSAVGRVITHVSMIPLPYDYLPKVHGSDDAMQAAWFKIEELPAMKDQFHDDHYLIINHLLSID